MGLGRGDSIEHASLNDCVLWPTSFSAGPRTRHGTGLTCQIRRAVGPQTQAVITGFVLRACPAVRCFDMLKRMNRKCAWIVAAALSCSPAMASYELALVQQWIDGRPEITRWDAPTGRYLGSFGRSFIPNAVGIGIDNYSDGTVLICYDRTSDIGYRRVDYSTGLSVATRFVSAPSATVERFYAHPSGLVMFAGVFDSLRQVRIYDSSLNHKRSLGYIGSTSWLGMALGTDGTVYTLNRDAGTNSGWKYVLNRYGLNASFPSSSLTLADDQVASDRYRSISFGADNILVGGSTTTNSRIVEAPSGGFGSQLSMYGYIASSSTVLHGHDDTIYSFGYDGSLGLMRSAVGTTATGGWGDLHDNSSAFFNNTTITGSAMVLAPEPGSMLALGAGLAALLARRRKNK